MSFLRNRLVNAYSKRAYPNYWDIIALFLVIGIITLLAWYGKQMAVPYQVGDVIPLSLDPWNLPNYAFRTVLRMLIALCFSLLFTFIFGTWAAKSKHAEKVIIPLIDILQSVPILGFISVSITFFIALFPGSLLGPECAAIFVIFTSQAWNMVFGFYQTVRTVPAELNEAADMLHLSAWQKFWRIDVPFSLPGLLWNTMMGMSAGWFFVVASEAISVANQEILLPGIGSYITLAIEAANLPAIGYAIIAMLLVILMYDQLLFRPLVTWSEKFRAEQEVLFDVVENQSWVINLLHRTRSLRMLGQQIAYLFDTFVNMAWLRSKTQTFKVTKPLLHPLFWSIVWYSVLMLSVAGALLFVGYHVFYVVPFSLIKHVFWLGLLTGLRVLACILICTVVWVPVGVWIGLRPRVAYIIQPLAQFLAAFPANLLYPIAVVGIFAYHLNVNIWVTPLMILGAQWYLLFNIIAGTSVLPKDLLQVADNLGLSTWLRWRRLILPGIFPYFVTGAITAAGGAWNASIVAEVASWGNKKLVAEGLGAFISQYTLAGNFIYTALGISVMCIIVLLLNRLVWRPLYVFAENRFQLT